MLDELLSGVVMGIGALVIIAAVSLVAAIPSYSLWNWLMPELFGVKMVTFWQAWGRQHARGHLIQEQLEVVHDH